MPTAKRRKGKERRGRALRVARQVLSDVMTDIDAAEVAQGAPSQALEDLRYDFHVTEQESLRAALLHVPLVRIPSMAAAASAAAAPDHAAELLSIMFKRRGRWRERERVMRLCVVWHEYTRAAPKVAPNRKEGGGILSSDFVCWVRAYVDDATDADIAEGVRRWKKGRKSEVRSTN